MDHLLSDIRRINPQGAPYCTFGELFVDPRVEQYYEALVGTMKAAKRNGLIAFKGQFLLKGMHDEVMVRIVDSDGDGFIPEDNQIMSAPGSCIVTKAPNTTKKWQPRKSLKPSVVVDKILKHGNKNTNVKLGNSDDAVSSVSFVTESDNPPYRPNMKTRIEIKRAKSMNFGEVRSNRDKRIVHTHAAGIAFHSNQKSETHFERVDREVNQLLIDILRITPEGSPFCTFGPLFEDPQVEQYYEALVGTLKSAKRKGLIQFKGQMLLKGMHDNVQIDIVE